MISRVMTGQPPQNTFLKFGIFRKFRGSGRVAFFRRHFSPQNKPMSAQQRYDNLASVTTDPLCPVLEQAWNDMVWERMGLPEYANRTLAEIDPAFEISDDESNLNQDIEFVVINDTPEDALSQTTPRSPTNMFDAFKHAATVPESPVKLTMELKYCYQYTCPKCEFGLHKVIYDDTDTYVPGELICLSC